MDEKVFMGLLIASLVVLLTIASLIAGLIVKPLLGLNQNITELKSSMKHFEQSIGHVEERITKHGKELDDVKDDIKDHEGRISKLEGVHRR